VERDERPTLVLKNGSRADVRHALLLVAGLAAELRHDPVSFHTVLAVAQGRAGELDSKSIDALKGTLLRPDGTLSAEDRDILLSSYHMVGDGPVLLNPFQLASTQDRLVVERVERQVAVHGARQTVCSAQARTRPG